MKTFLNELLLWSEVWALLIPLTIIFIYKIKGQIIRPVVIYVFIAFFLNTAADVISYFNNELPNWLRSNQILYNIHSIARTLLFSWYILKLNLKYPIWLKRAVVPLYLVFLLVNFIFLEPMTKLSTHLTSAESIVLLVLCILYFITAMNDENINNITSSPSFVICTGLIIYEAVTFFIFLFYDILAKEYHSFGILTMKIFSVTLIIFCICLSIGLYKSRKNMPLRSSTQSL